MSFSIRWALVCVPGIDVVAPLDACGDLAMFAASKTSAACEADQQVVAPAAFRP